MRRHKAIRVDFDGLRAIASRQDTGDVLGSDDLTPLLEFEPGSLLRKTAIEALVTQWLSELARQEIDPARLVPLVRRAPADAAPETVWSEKLDGDLHLYAALDLPGALVPLSESDLAACNLSSEGIRVRLRSNWAAKQRPLQVKPRPGGLVELSLRDVPELATSLLNGPNLSALLEGLGWGRARLVVPGRDRLVLANADDPGSETRLRDELSRDGAEPESSLIWEVTSDGDVSPICKAA